MSGNIVVVLSLIVLGLVVALLIPRKYRLHVAVFAISLNIFQPVLSMAIPPFGNASIWYLYPSLGAILGWAITGNSK